MTEEKLLDQDKEYVKDFVFELYRKSLCPEDTLLDWAQKQIQEKCSLGSDKIGDTIAKLLARVSNNDQIYDDYLTKPRDEQIDLLDGWLKKLGINYVYTKENILSTDPEHQRMILSEIHKQFPYVFEKCAVSPDILLEIVNYYLRAGKSQQL